MLLLRRIVSSDCLWANAIRSCQRQLFTIGYDDANEINNLLIWSQLFVDVSLNELHNVFYGLFSYVYEFDAIDYR